MRKFTMNIQTRLSPQLMPHQTDKIYITDSGLETVLVFHNNLDLPQFAAFPLLATSNGREILSRYYTRHIEIALKNRVGFILDSPT